MDRRQKPTFLNLPRELRNEVYKHLLLFDLSPKGKTKLPSMNSLVPRYELVSVQISILRINKQIHDEAAEIFYGSNTFHVQIVASKIHHRFRRFRLAYHSPWETIEFDCEGRRSWEDHQEEGLLRERTIKFVNQRINSENIAPLRYNYLGRRIIDNKLKEKIAFTRILGDKEANSMKIPPSRYQHLFRRIRLDIIELYIPFDYYSEYCYSREYLRSMLFPALNRLKNCLYNAGKLVQADINVISPIFQENWWNLPSVLTEKNPASRQRLKEKQDLRMYKALCRFLWPLKTMQWKYGTIKTQFSSRFPGVMEHEFQMCSIFSLDMSRELKWELQKGSEDLERTRRKYVWASI